MKPIRGIYVNYLNGNQIDALCLHHEDVREAKPQHEQLMEVLPAGWWDAFVAALRKDGLPQGAIDRASRLADAAIAKEGAPT